MKQGKLLTAQDIMERYNCSENTARSYMRQMIHMEKPLRVSEAALDAWEANRTMAPMEAQKGAKNGKQRHSAIMPPKDGHLISRVRPKAKEA